MADYLDTSRLNIVNGAVSGQSSRTFQREGSWTRLTTNVKPGDFVIIQFGHNDVTDVMTSDPIRQRGSIQTLGEETVQSPLGETVHTFGWYMRKMIKEVQDKGATPIVVSLTTRNEWQNGKVERGFKEMNKLAIQLARDQHVAYVDLTNIAADAYDAMGPDKVKTLYGTDTTHTIAEGADLNAKFIVSGLKALKNHPFDQFLTEKGKSVEPDTKYAEK
jgi:lysophospholipase L1-like esterase